MKTTLKEEDNNLVMYFDGRLDTTTSPETEMAMKPLIDCAGRNIVLDCSKLEYISSSGLRIFLNILKNAKAKGSSVYIRNVGEVIGKVFRMTGFYNLFEIKE